jgi:organic hydroperoxide reductase OsmC/OhrA
MFKQFLTRAELTVPAGTDVAKARTLLEKAEHACLIANSLRGDRALEVTVTVA